MSEARQNSVRHLAELYTIVIALALTVAIESDTLSAGFDYLVDPYSGTSVGNFSCYYINFTNIPKEGSSECLAKGPPAQGL